MNAPIAKTALALALALAVAVPALAQGPATRTRMPAASNGPPAASPIGTATGGGTSPARDPKVFPAATALPEPTKPDDLKGPTIPLPTEDIEPYLLTELVKDAGPFMVLARSFRGPDAAKYAQALAMELRGQYQLPAWVYLSRYQPMHSNIRNVPPTAENYVQKPQLTPPEKYRIYDEAAVLVGNCKTLAESTTLLHQVKKLHPQCLKGLPSLYKWRADDGLKKALRTTNPFIPAQYLYPRKTDPLIAQMNSGPNARRSLFRCPGRFTLQVAEFSGRSSFNPNDPEYKGDRGLRSSPLQTAADDAQKLADNLAKVDRIQRTGYQTYVYHDRYSSKVTIGSFNAPNDPAAEALRRTVTEIAPEFYKKRLADSSFVPAPDLLDLQTLPPH